jgi:carbamoyltransferase
MLYNKMAEDELLEQVAEDISNNKVVGWFQGGSEFGPRALGHRSIFTNPCWKGAKPHLNDKVKQREYWRPYAPIVATDDASKYFDIVKSVANPYMLLSYSVKVDTLPGITHEDGSARIQTVNAEQNNKVYKLLKCIKNKIGVSVLLNTSFNLGGEPIVESPKDAVKTFINSNIDVLVLENYYITKGGE